MKKILITGADSYIGVSFQRWLSAPGFKKNYHVDTIEMRGEGWRQKDFSGYDVVFHVAGIAHVAETEENKPIYYQVNRELAADTAVKAKKEGVRQFVFLSSMSIYGLETGVITEKTQPAPKTHYGKSKWQAEEKIRRMGDGAFKIAVLRPPMIYGKNCRGNYPLLSRFAKKCPLFPYTPNSRSMLFIDNLSEFVREMIDGEKEGVFFPQNREYVNVSQLAEMIAGLNGRKLFLLRGCDRLLTTLGGAKARKVLDTLIYDIEKDRCDTVSFEESIRRTEN